MSDGLSLFGYVNENFRSRTALVNPRSQFGWQKAYGLTNAGIGLRSEQSGWSANVWAKNLFDYRYAIGFGAPTAFTPQLQYYGEPRTWGLTLAKTF